MKLRFRTPARDIPPFFLQRRGPERTFMDLNGLETDASDAVISGSLSKIKDPGDLVRSPIYGAGEGNIRPSRTPSAPLTAVYDP